MSRIIRKKKSGYAEKNWSRTPPQQITEANVFLYLARRCLLRDIDVCYTAIFKKGSVLIKVGQTSCICVTCQAVNLPTIERPKLLPILKGVLW